MIELDEVYQKTFIQNHIKEIKEVIWFSILLWKISINIHKKHCNFIGIDLLPFCRSGNEEKLMALLTPLNVNCHASDGRKVSHLWCKIPLQWFLFALQLKFLKLAYICVCVYIYIHTYIWLHFTGIFSL